jgi:hypothetical protein
VLAKLWNPLINLISLSVSNTDLGTSPSPVRRLVPACQIPHLQVPINCAASFFFPCCLSLPRVPLLLLPALAPVHPHPPPARRVPSTVAAASCDPAQPPPVLCPSSLRPCLLCTALDLPASRLASPLQAVPAQRRLWPLRALPPAQHPAPLPSLQATATGDGAATQETP